MGLSSIVNMCNIGLSNCWWIELDSTMWRALECEMCDLWKQCDQYNHMFANVSTQQNARSVCSDCTMDCGFLCDHRYLIEPAVCSLHVLSVQIYKWRNWSDEENVYDIRKSSLCDQKIIRAMRTLTGNLNDKTETWLPIMTRILMWLKVQIMQSKMPSVWS